MFGTTFEGSRLVHQPAIDDAKVHLTRSWVMSGVAPLLLMVVLFWIQMAVVRALILTGSLIYIVWACYWGFVGLFDTVTMYGERLFHNPKTEHMAITFILHVFGVGLPLVIAILYGILGGGAYQYVRYRRIASNVSYRCYTSAHN